MNNFYAGEIVTLKVDRKTDFGFFLTNGVSDNKEDDVLLPNKEVNGDIQLGEEREFFLFHDKLGRLTASMTIPEITLDDYGWGEVVGARRNLGVFVNIGITKDVLVSLDEMPLHAKLWPKVGDRLFIRLYNDKDGRLFGTTATEDVIQEELVNPAPEKMYNKMVKGYIYKTKKVGSYLITDEGYRCFIHEKERNKEPRLGEYVEGRVIDQKEDGSLNVSLLPFALDKMQEDSDIIMQYLGMRGGAMPFSDKSTPADIMETFNLSKAAFKRALGKLMKEDKIYQEDGWTYTSDRR
ncbi:MAG: S1 RNA-binding domain-containing protein [Bacillus sp. (in: firmicutes)]